MKKSPGRPKKDKSLLRVNERATCRLPKTTHNLS